MQKFRDKVMLKPLHVWARAVKFLLCLLRDSENKFVKAFSNSVLKFYYCNLCLNKAFINPFMKKQT